MPLGAEWARKAPSGAAGPAELCTPELAWPWQGSVLSPGVCPDRWEPAGTLSCAPGEAGTMALCALPQHLSLGSA